MKLRIFRVYLFSSSIFLAALHIFPGAPEGSRVSCYIYPPYYTPPQSSSGLFVYMPVGRTIEKLWLNFVSSYIRVHITNRYKLLYVCFSRFSSPIKQYPFLFEMLTFFFYCFMQKPSGSLGISSDKLKHDFNPNFFIWIKKNVERVKLATLVYVFFSFSHTQLQCIDIYSNVCYTSRCHGCVLLHHSNQTMG